MTTLQITILYYILFVGDSRTLTGISYRSVMNGSAMQSPDQSTYRTVNYISKFQTYLCRQSFFFQLVRLSAWSSEVPLLPPPVCF